MKSEDIRLLGLVCGAILFSLLLTITAWITSSYFEAKAFNSITGKNVTTRQAMFLELRIKENVEQKYNKGL